MKTSLENALRSAESALSDIRHALSKASDPVLLASYRNAERKTEAALSAIRSASALYSGPRFLCNIGADVSHRFPDAAGPITWDNVKEAAALIGAEALLLREAQSTTEKTFVAILRGPTLTREKLAKLAGALSQDCIACVPVDLSGVDTGFGFLAGPYADAWGEFNAGFFLR